MGTAVLPAADLEFAEVKVAPALAVQVSGHCAPDPASISAAVQNAFQSVMNFITHRGLKPSGPARTIYTGHKPEQISFIVAQPVAAGPVRPFDEPHLRVETLPAKHAYRFTHHGPYSDLGQTYKHIDEFMRAKGLMKSQADWQRYMPMWEEYQNDPQTTPPEQLQTYIYLPAN